MFQKNPKSSEKFRKVWREVYLVEDVALALSRASADANDREGSFDGSESGHSVGVHQEGARSVLEHEAEGTAGRGRGGRIRRGPRGRTGRQHAPEHGGRQMEASCACFRSLFLLFSLFLYFVGRVVS